MKLLQKHIHVVVIFFIVDIIIIFCAIIFIAEKNNLIEINKALVIQETILDIPQITELEAPESPFLKEEEVIIIAPETKQEEETILPITKVLFEYIEIIDGCGTHFQGECLNVRSGPGTDYPVVANLRNGIVLKVGGKVERDNHDWYKIIFDEYLHYPERVTSDWYVSADYVKVLLDEGERAIWNKKYATTTKQIIVNRAEQMLYAYDGDVLFMMVKTSTGLELTPTPKGTFHIYKKTPSRYMQGPLPGIAAQYYDLPGVPWNLYFTREGAVIHGAYWHESFGTKYSHGCVNLAPNVARELYNWADLGTKVIVEDW